MGKRRPLARVDGNRIRKHVSSNSSIQSSSTDASSLVNDDEFNFLSGPMNKKTKTIPKQQQPQQAAPPPPPVPQTKWSDKTPKISNCSQRPDTNNKEQKLHSDNVTTRRVEPNSKQQHGSAAVGSVGSHGQREVPPKGSLRPDGIGTSSTNHKTNAIKVQSSSTIHKSNPNTKQHTVATRKKVSKFIRGSLETIYEDDQPPHANMEDSSPSPPPPVNFVPKITVAEIHHIVLGSTVMSIRPVSSANNKDDDQTQSSTQQPKNQQEKWSPLRSDINDSTHHESFIQNGGTDKSNPDDDMDLVQDDNSLSSTSTTPEEMNTTTLSAEPKSIERTEQAQHDENDLHSSMAPERLMNNDTFSTSLLPPLQQSSSSTKHADADTDAPISSNAQDKRESNPSSAITKESTDQSPKFSSSRIALSVDTKSNRAVAHSIIAPGQQENNKTDMPLPHETNPSNTVPPKLRTDTKSKGLPHSNKKSIRSCSMEEPVKPFSFKTLQNYIHSPPDNQAVLKVMLASHSGDVSHASPFSNIVINLDSVEECSLDKSDLTMDEDVSPHHYQPIVDYGHNHRNDQQTRRGQSEQSIRPRVQESGFKNKSVSQNHLLHSGLIPTPRNSENETSPALWTAEDAGSVNAALIFRLPDGRRFRHPPLPPGWTLGVDRTQNRPYYYHPDFGCSFHAPVPLPTRRYQVGDDTIRSIAVEKPANTIPIARPDPVLSEVLKRSQLATPVVYQQDDAKDIAFENSLTQQYSNMVTTQLDHMETQPNITSTQPSSVLPPESYLQAPYLWQYSYETPMLPLPLNGDANYPSTQTEPPVAPTSFHSTSAIVDMVKVAVLSHRQRRETPLLAMKTELANANDEIKSAKTNETSSYTTPLSDSSQVDCRQGRSIKTEGLETEVTGSKETTTYASIETRLDTAIDIVECGQSEKISSLCTLQNQFSKSSVEQGDMQLGARDPDFATPALGHNSIDIDSVTNITMPTSKSHDRPNPVAYKGLNVMQAVDTVDLIGKVSYESPDIAHICSPKNSNSIRQPFSDRESMCSESTAGPMVEQGDAVDKPAAEYIHPHPQAQQSSTCLSENHDNREQVLHERMVQHPIADAAVSANKCNYESPPVNQMKLSPAFDQVCQASSGSDSSTAAYFVQSSPSQSPDIADTVRSPYVVNIGSGDITHRQDAIDTTDQSSAGASRIQTGNHRSSCVSSVSHQSSRCLSRKSYRALHPPMPLCSLQNVDKLRVSKRKSGRVTA